MSAIEAPTHTPSLLQPQARGAVRESVALTIASFVSYWVTAHLLARVRSISPADHLIGGMWAVIATLFVYRTSYRESAAAAVSRRSAALVSFALCLIYLLILPFHPFGLAALIGIETLVLTLIKRHDDVVTAGSPRRS